MEKEFNINNTRYNSIEQLYKLPAILVFDEMNSLIVLELILFSYRRKKK